MQKKTAEQAAAIANTYFQGRCTARVIDFGNRVAFDMDGADSIDVAGDQVFDVDRFERLLKNLEDGMQWFAAKANKSL